MARMTRDLWLEMYAQADRTAYYSIASQLGVVEVIEGRAKSAHVRDAEDGSLLGVFTMAKLRSAWTAMAAKQGQSGIAWYESGEPDATDYSDAFEIALCGEIIYA